MAKKAVGNKKAVDWVKILAEVEAGVSVTVIARREGITTAAIYRQRKQAEAGRSRGVPGRPNSLGEQSIRITVRVPSDLNAALSREASARKVTESDVVRLALEGFLQPKAAKRKS